MRDNQRENEAIRLRNVAEKEYRVLQQVINEGRSTDGRSFPPLLLPPATWLVVDWTLFMSSYRHSTETCGYTNSENLRGLQSSLKGGAKDSDTRKLWTGCTQSL